MKSKENKFIWHALDAKPKSKYSIVKAADSPALPFRLLNVYKPAPK